MLESLFRSALVRRRMAAVHLSIILEDFVLHLERRGHVLTCIQSYTQIVELMPLPQIDARAISAYLHHGRPVSASGAVFVRHRAPLGQPLRVHHVRGAMRRAMSRADLPSTRVHLLRHSFATRLHQKGVGLKAIADLLGHQTLDITASYAHVDVGELREAALPWPEDWR